MTVLTPLALASRGARNFLLEALAVVFLASGLVAGAALDMRPLLSRHCDVFRQHAGLRVEPQLGVLLHEGSPVLPVPAALAVAGGRAEKLTLEALAVALEAGGLLAVATRPRLFILIHGPAELQTDAGGRPPSDGMEHVRAAAQLAYMYKTSTTTKRLFCGLL